MIDTQLRPEKDGGADRPSGSRPEVHLTDLGNARRVVARHGKDLRYCHPWKTWLVWDGRRWAEDDAGGAVLRVKETVGWLYRSTSLEIKALGDVGDDEERKARLRRLTSLLAHALKWEDVRRIGASLELAKSEPSVPVRPQDLDRDPMLLNVLNGTIDLHTGRLQAHRRGHNITKLAPVHFDAAAECPTWIAFLDRIMARNQSLIDYLQRVAGYCLTGQVSEQMLWFFHGNGANGKSTFLGAVRELLGDYGLQAVSELLLEKKHESHPAERADLFGRRFVATIETDEGKRMAEALMKQLTGGDKIRARKLYQQLFEFEPTHKIILAANHKPVIRGTDHAVWRRVKMVPFEVTIPENEKDKALPDKLRAEFPGVLAWAVHGCLDWQERGLCEPAEVSQATRTYQAEQDAVAGFLEACCVASPDVKVKASALFEAYVEWSGDRVTTGKAFGQRMRDKGYESARGQGGAVFWQGIGLRPEEHV